MASRNNTREAYGYISIALHWIVGILVIGMLTLGWTMVNLEDPELATVLFLYTLHKSVGIVLLVLIAVRVVRYLRQTKPDPLGNPPHWQTRLSRTAHALLLLSMSVMVISGWLLSDFSKYPVMFFWVLQMPDLLPISEPLQEIATEIHEITAWVTAILAGFHVLAALKHHFVNRDRTLLRMLGRPRP